MVDKDRIQKEIEAFKKGEGKLSRDYDVRTGPPYSTWREGIEETTPLDPADRAAFLREEDSLWYQPADPDKELRMVALRNVDLTERQEAVLRLFRQPGMTQEEAGRILGINHAAVHYHLRAIEKKLQAWVTDKKGKSDL